MAHYFITSTGTDIGKTLVTACLAWQSRAQSAPYMAIKPVLSGVEDDNSMIEGDTGCLAKAQGLPLTAETWDRLTPMRYKAPLAPNMAAKLEGRALDFDALVDFCRTAMAKHDDLLIEGVGGSFVPLTDKYLVADWVKALNIKSILVVGSYLGTISHTIATVEAMKMRGLAIHSIIISESEGDCPDLNETKENIEALTGIESKILPRLAGDVDLWEIAPALL